MGENKKKTILNIVANFEKESGGRCRYGHTTTWIEINIENLMLIFNTGGDQRAEDQMMGEGG